jgi:hypothetical protein
LIGLCGILILIHVLLRRCHYHHQHHHPRKFHPRCHEDRSVVATPSRRGRDERKRHDQSRWWRGQTAVTDSFALAAVCAFAATSPWCFLFRTLRVAILRSVRLVFSRQCNALPPSTHTRGCTTWRAFTCKFPLPLSFSLSPSLPLPVFSLLGNLAAATAARWQHPLPRPFSLKTTRRTGLYKRVRLPLVVSSRALLAWHIFEIRRRRRRRIRLIPQRLHVLCCSRFLVHHH